MERNRNGCSGLYYHHSIFVLHARFGHHIFPRCATTVRADLRARSWKEGKHLDDNYSGSWFSYGVYSLLWHGWFFMNWLIEHDCCYCRIFTACIRRCKRRGLTIVRMDRQGRLARTTSQCSDRHLHLRCHSSLFDYSQSSRIHLARLSRGCSDDCSIWPHRCITLDDDTWSFQVFSFRAWKIFQVILYLRRLIQWPGVRSESLFTQ